MRNKIGSCGIMSPTGLAMLIALGFILGGLYVASTGSPGTGLMVVGVGVLIGGFGGSASMGFGLLKVAGPAGLILIVVGGVFRLLAGA